MFQLNLQSVVEMTQKIRPHLAKTRGEIVNVSSIAAGPAAVSLRKKKQRNSQKLIIYFSNRKVHTTLVQRLPLINIQEVLQSI